MRPDKPHESMRGYFAYELYLQMEKNKSIWMITADLGYGMLDAIRDDFSDRFLNVGASEQVAVDIACGLALSGKIPFVYSITPFLMWRAAEAIRLYVNHEKLPVKLIGGGRDNDYYHDGFSHNAKDIKTLLEALPSIVEYWPNDKVEIKWVLSELISNNQPSFVSLKR